MAKYGVAMLGAGWVAGEYVKAFRDHPLTEFVGAYAPTKGKSTALMQKHGVDGYEYGSEDELFDDDRVDIIVSATHPDVRPRQCVRAAETGRHIVIEKPIALSREEVHSIREAVAKAGVKTVTSVVLRWNPQIITVRQLIKDGVFGELIYCDADYWHPIKRAYPGYHSMVSKKRGGSALMLGGCHAADIVRFLAGEVTEVTAVSMPPRINHDYEFDPNIAATLRFANGGIGRLTTIMDADTPYIFNTRLVGTEATIVNNEVYSSKHYPGSLGFWSFPTIPPNSGDVAHHPFPQEVAHFIECIENDVESHASIHDTWKSMELCFAMDDSAAAGGKCVKLNTTPPAAN